MSTISSGLLALLARLLAAGTAVAVVLAGIWLAGGVVTDDFRASMALTGLWFVLVLAGSYLLWTRLPSLRLAALAGVGAFVLVGGALALATVRDRTVNEILPSGPVTLSGEFEPRAHPTRGTAAVVRTPRGSVLTLTDFRTDAGPDLFVYLVPGGTGDDVDGGVRLGELKGNIGNQQYALPAGFRPGQRVTAVIWCRAFSVAFGAAQLGELSRA